MSYSEMLSQIIEESELSLRQISKRCADLDLNITPSYISQLKNGKLPPPSEEVSLVLAKACGSKNQAQLVFQGYMEKAPELVKEYMLASSALNKIMLETLCQTDNNGPMSREFKKNIGKSPIDYLIDVRMSRAKSLLYDSNRSISSICQLVGIPNPNHFLYLFKEREGITPSAFRKFKL